MVSKSIHHPTTIGIVEEKNVFDSFFFLLCHGQVVLCVSRCGQCFMQQQQIQQILELALVRCMLSIPVYVIRQKEQILIIDKRPTLQYTAFQAITFSMLVVVVVVVVIIKVQRNEFYWSIQVSAVELEKFFAKPMYSAIFQFNTDYLS